MSTSSITPLLKSPTVVESVQALTNVVKELKSAVERMDKRLAAIEDILRTQVSVAYMY